MTFRMSSGSRMMFGMVGCDDCRNAWSDMAVTPGCSATSLKRGACSKGDGPAPMLWHFEQ